MGLLKWARDHRGLAAFVAGVLLTLVALAAVGYLVLSDQRRSARVLGAALSQALAREVRIDRVTELGTARVVMRGVRLPRAGGWPADISAAEVEATGPLLAAARGDEAPLRLVVTRPTVEASAGGAGAGLAALDGVREGLASFLGASTLLDVSLSGGTVRRDGTRVEFDLTLRKGRGDAKAELTLRAPRGAPLVIALDGRMDGETARLSLEGHGGLLPLAPWIPDGLSGSPEDSPLALRADVAIGPARTTSAHARLTLGTVAALEGGGTVRDGVVEMALARVSADLGFAARVAGLGWRPAGRAELGDVKMTWRPEAGEPPTVSAVVRVPTLELPAAAIGVDVAAEGVEGRLTLEPVAAGLVARGEAQVARLRAAGLDVSPAQTRYRLSLDARGAVSRAELDGLTARVAGAALAGSLGYDVDRRRVDARLGGEEVEVAELVRRVAPGWLGDADRLRLAGLRVTATGLDLATLRAGAAQLETRGLALRRADGELSTGRAMARATLDDRGIVVGVEADGVSGALPFFRGALPRLAASVHLARPGAGGLELGRAQVTARDREGRELLAATARPVGPAAGARVALSARAPDLGRLHGLWPELERRVNGSASLDVELAGPGGKAADGRLALRVEEAELLGGTLSLRDVTAELPVRRGAEAAGPPPWGRIEASELIGYGLVVRDVTASARVFGDRLSLNDLAYALYSGEGKGWAEVEIEPAGPVLTGKLTGERVRVEEFIGAYGIRGGTMTGLLRYDLDVRYRAGRIGVNGRLEVPEGGTVNIELLNRLLAHAESDPTGVLRSVLENLRSFDYKSAEADVRSGGSGGDDIFVSLALRGRERFGIFPPRVREINVRRMPLSFLARQFPAR